MSSQPAPNPKKRTILDIMAAKNQRKLAMITSYDAPFTHIIESALAEDSPESGPAPAIDIILVGDSVSMAMLGRTDTNSVTMEEMLHHVRAVMTTATHSLVVADMPFLSYEAGPEIALKNAGRFFQEAGARAVKLEGGRQIVPQIKALTAAGIPVMGHLGLTPQRAATLGGFKAQARTAEGAQNLLADALALEQAGCFAIVLECVPATVAAYVTEQLSIPTIGIGAGPHCDGQVLVLHDLLGMSSFVPRFAKVYAQVNELVRQAVQDYAREVRSGSFPAAAHCFTMPATEEAEWNKNKKPA